MQDVMVSAAERDSVVEQLGELRLFGALSRENLERVLTAGVMEQVDDEGLILAEAAPSDSFFVVLSGCVSVAVRTGSGELAHISDLAAPLVLGEVGLLLDRPRTATVTAKGPVRLLRFSAAVFARMSEQIPRFSLALAQGLAARLEQVSGLVPLPDYDLDPAALEPATVGLLPMAFLERHRVLPVKAEGNQLTLGCVETLSPAVLDMVRRHLPGMDVLPVRIRGQAFDAYMRSAAGAGGWQRDQEAAPAPPVEAPAECRSPRLDALLRRVVSEGASDLHLCAAQQPRWRIDGDLHPIEDTAVLATEEAAELLFPVMEERHLREFRETKDVDFSYASANGSRFRVNLFTDHHGASAALRLIPSQIMTLEQLGMPDILKSLCDLPKGLILVTGPTGSGKSTTLAALINHVNETRSVHIITMEDPIEFVHPSKKALVNQREVGGHAQSFARALRAALREDPDIVLVGEMRDTETMMLAMELANTGHLVFGTLHTSSAVSTVDRIIDSFPADQEDQLRTSLSDNLKGVVSQMLCKRRTGGRCAALEIMVVTRAIANLLREGKTIQIPSMMQAGKQDGQLLLNQHLATLVERKQVQYTEALGKSMDREDLSRRLNLPLPRGFI
ncbi:MAG: PilT/PilU family type 4a pilus ATPase [Candidatus Schekmanbacteria bacterium]|nr:PilT/PilU family type 4a pilus ATPase [Candidatus Schekmanbacteria bacterium]